MRMSLSFLNFIKWESLNLVKLYKLMVALGKIPAPATTNLITKINLQVFPCKKPLCHFTGSQSYRQDFKVIKFFFLDS